MKKFSLIIGLLLAVSLTGCAQQAIDKERHKAYKKQQQIEASDRAHRELKGR